MMRVLALFCIALFVCGEGHAESAIPAHAWKFIPALKSEVATVWPGAPAGATAYIAGLIEHESGCPSMPRKCWNPSAELKTSKERGGGLGQLTVAYRVDGSVRFDKLAELRDTHPALRELSWATLFQRPDLQLRAIAVMVKAGHKRFATVPINARWDFADAGYNGGDSGTLAEQRHCGLTKGCNPNVWFGNVEDHCLKSRKPLYGTRSPCDINRHHVRDVRIHRQPKYAKAGV